MDRAISRLLVVVLLSSTWVGSIRAAESDEELKQKALSLNGVTGEAVILGHLRNMIKDEAGTKKLLSVALKIAKEDEKAFKYNAAFILGKAAQIYKDPEAAKTFYRICIEDAFKLQSEMKTVQAYDALILAFYQNEKFDDTIKTCEEFIDIRADKPDSPINQLKPLIIEQMIKALAKSGKFEEAKKLNDKQVDGDEGGWYFLQNRGWILREEGKLEEAAEAYLEVIERLKKNRSLSTTLRERFSNGIHYLLSSIYVDMKKIDKAAEHLQILLKKDPDNATYNNDLGFIWADHDMKLDEAEKLIRKAIDEDRKDRKKDETLTSEEDKDNPAYLDSLGWVLYKKKDYKEAKKYLLLACEEKEGQHIEILDHLADVHMALGEKEEALKVWKKAIAVDMLTKRDKERKVEVEKKIKKAEEGK
jgi:tetratricopeptide (TPR) repeat protein